MEYVNEISINEAIIHILDNNAEEAILNEIPLILSEELYEFIYKHLAKSFKDEDLKYAKFEEGRGVVKDTSRAFFNNEIDFITMSKEIAIRLFTIMKSNVGISSCDLLVVSFLTEFGSMIGILKMDYVKNYAHSVDFQDDKIGIKIIEQYSGLPSSGQKLQKCAFIKEKNSEYDLLVIDKKSKGKDSDDYGVNFFLVNYLNCNILLNRRDNTKTFIKAAEDWTQKSFNGNAEKAEFVRSSLKKKLNEEEVLDVKSVAEEIFKDLNEERESFTEYVINKGISEQVEVDKAYVDKKMSRIRLKIDKDIDIYLNQDAYNDDLRFEVKKNGDGSINMIIKNVKNYIEK